MPCPILNLMMSYGLEQPARSLEVPYRTPHLHHTPFPREEISDHTWPPRARLVPENLEEVVDGAAIDTTPRWCCHRQHTVDNLLQTCHLHPAGRNMKETGRSSLWTPEARPGPIGVCFTNTRPTLPGPASNCDSPILSTKNDPQKGTSIREGTWSTCMAFA